jgi:hypothetical protein
MMSRIVIAALAALILLGPTDTQAETREAACYRAPDLNDMCVRFTGIEVRQHANGVRTVQAPFIMRTPEGQYLIEGQFFEASCVGKRVLGTALRDARGTQYDSHAEPWEMLDYMKALAQDVCDWEAPHGAKK